MVSFTHFIIQRLNGGYRNSVFFLSAYRIHFDRFETPSPSYFHVVDPATSRTDAAPLSWGLQCSQGARQTQDQQIILIRN